MLTLLNHIDGAGRFVPEDISTQGITKSSAARGIRSAILEQFPLLEPHIDDILPKKTAIVVAKWYA